MMKPLRIQVILVSQLEKVELVVLLKSVYFIPRRIFFKVVCNSDFYFFCVPIKHLKINV